MPPLNGRDDILGFVQNPRLVADSSADLVSELAAYCGVSSSGPGNVIAVIWTGFRGKVSVNVGTIAKNIELRSSSTDIDFPPPMFCEIQHSIHLEYSNLTFVKAPANDASIAANK